jgi:hypothetical protein
MNRLKSKYINKIVVIKKEKDVPDHVFFGLILGDIKGPLT